MRIALVLLLVAAPIAAQPAPAYHLTCRRIVAGEAVTPTGAMQRRAGGADFFAGCAALRNRQWGDASAAFVRAAAVDSLNAVYRMWVGRARGEEIRRISAFRQLALFQQLRRDVNRAVELDTMLIEARIFQIEMVVNMPAALGGSPGDARDMARSLSALSPYFGAIALARVNTVTGDSASAIRDLRALAKAHPDSIAPHVTLLSLLVNGGRAAEARAVIAEMKRTAPLQLIADFYTGHVAATTGEGLTAGEAALRRYVAVVRPHGYPRRAVAHWNLARIQERRGRVPDAITELRASLRLDPDFVEAKKDLARLEKR